MSFRLSTLPRVLAAVLFSFAPFLAADGFAHRGGGDREVSAAAQKALHECFAERGGDSWEEHGECWEEFGRKMSETHGGFWREARREGWGRFAAVAVIAVVAVIALPIFIVVAGVVMMFRRKEVPAAGALGILADRFARGEIDENEYRARRDAIKKG